MKGFIHELSTTAITEAVQTLLVKSSTIPKIINTSQTHENVIVNTKKMHTMTHVWITFIWAAFIVSVRFTDVDNFISFPRCDK